MIHLKGSTAILWLLIVIGSLCCAPRMQVSNYEATASSTSPAIPLFKGFSVNPMVRIAVTVPAQKEVSYQTLEGTLSQSALAAIEKLDVFFTDTVSSFSARNLMGSVNPSSNRFSIPITINWQPGVQYIWLSAVLKNDADINGFIEVHATELNDNQNNKLTISEDASAYKKRIGTVVRKAGDDGVNTYRIPGIITTDKGTLISVYDIRYKNSGDLPGDIDVGMSRSTDGGKTWQPKKIIMDMGAPHENNGVGDPAVLFDPVTKKIWVAALWSKGNRSIAGSKPGLSPDTTGQFVLVSSDDDGLTWTKPYSITEQVKDPKWHLFFNGPGNGIAMQDGKLVFPAQYWDENKMPFSTIIYSADYGKNWIGKIGGPKANTTESQVVETTAGTLMLNMRDNRGNFRSVATTSNMGDSWTEHQSSYSALPDPVCMASLIKAKTSIKGVQQEILFFSNPATSSARKNMTIKASLDAGETWLPAHQLLIDERLGYGYSSLTKVDDYTIGILYEGVKNLYFVRVPVNEIIK